MFKVVKEFSLKDKVYAVEEFIHESLVTLRMKELGLVTYVEEEIEKIKEEFEEKIEEVTKKKPVKKKKEQKEQKEQKEEILTEVSSNVEVEKSDS